MVQVPRSFTCQLVWPVINRYYVVQNNTDVLVLRRSNVSEFTLSQTREIENCMYFPQNVN